MVKFNVPDAPVTPLTLAEMSVPPLARVKVLLAPMPLIVWVPALSVPLTVNEAGFVELADASLMALAPESEEASKATPLLTVTLMLGVVLPETTAEISPDPVQLPLAAKTRLWDMSAPWGLMLPLFTRLPEIVSLRDITVTVEAPNFKVPPLLIVTLFATLSLFTCIVVPPTMVTSSAAVGT